MAGNPGNSATRPAARVERPTLDRGEGRSALHEPGLLPRNCHNRIERRIAFLTSGTRQQVPRTDDHHDHRRRLAGAPSGPSRPPVPAGCERYGTLHALADPRHLSFKDRAALRNAARPDGAGRGCGGSRDLTHRASCPSGASLGWRQSRSKPAEASRADRRRMTRLADY